MRALFSAVGVCAVGFASQARADMFDYGFQFSNVAAAIVDGVAQGVYNPVSPSKWFYDHVQPGLQCWEPSQDTTVTNPLPPPATLTTHTYLTGYYVLVSVVSLTPIPAFASDPNLAFILDRTQREAGAASYVVQNNIGAVIADLGCAPMFASSNPYPIGGFQ